jgi:hypothetical protein
MTPFSQLKSQQPQNHMAFEDSMVNGVYTFTSIVTMPVELALRLFHGTRYFSPIVTLLSALMMVFIPLLFSFAGAVGQFLPLGRKAVSLGLIGMWGLSRLFFLGCLVHGVRKWRLMVHMERESISTYEGPPLFFFTWLPKASFWRIRVLYEPIFVFCVSIVLPNLFILDNAAGNFLMFSAFMLAMKNYAAWYIQWQFIRQLMDMKFAGPIIAKLAENRDDDEDLNSLHLASFPKDLPPDIRKSAVAHIARAFSPGEEER